MTTTISYGAADSCELALGDHTFLAPDAEGHPPLADPAAAMRAALSAPRGYPPLAAAVVPGDHVAIAVGKGLPQLASLLRGAIAELVQAGVEPTDVTVLSAEPLDVPAKFIGESGVKFAVHDVRDESQLALLAVTADGRPLRLNRALVEAELVLPIATARMAPGGEGPPAKYAGLYPQFSSRETVDRFYGRGHGSPDERRIERTAEADEAGWRLGVGLTVQVVPSAGGGVAAIVSGEPGLVATEAAELFRAIWERPIPRQGDLVIAALTGDANEQTWSNLARAVAAAGRVARPEGAIAVCCELDQTPDGSFDRLRDALDFDAVAKRLRRDGAADAARSAMLLAQALHHGPVYLRSRLPTDVVESLGMTPIESDAELARLAAARRHCVVIEDAQRLKPRLVGGSDDVE